MRFTPTSRALEPCDQEARKWCRVYAGKGNGSYEIEVLHDRDMIEHRRIFAQIAELAKALHRDPENVRAELLYKTGNFQVLGELFGKTLICINSMSRRHMTDHELHQFWGDALLVIQAELLPQIKDPAERASLAGSLLLGEAAASTG
jgi:hypothetical protein